MIRLPVKVRSNSINVIFKENNSILSKSNMKIFIWWNVEFFYSPNTFSFRENNFFKFLVRSSYFHYDIFRNSLMKKQISNYKWSTWVSCNIRCSKSHWLISIYMYSKHHIWSNSFLDFISDKRNSKTSTCCFKSMNTWRINVWFLNDWFDSIMNFLGWFFNFSLKLLSSDCHLKIHIIS